LNVPGIGAARVGTEARPGAALRRTVYRGWRRGFIYLVLGIWAVISLFPLYWLFVTAFQPASLTMAFPPQLVPSLPTVANFQSLFSGTDIARWLLNSVVVTGALTASNLLLDTMAGYALAKMRFAGRRIVFWSIVSLLMVPWQVTLIPVYVITVKLGMLNSYPGLILPGLVSPFGIFLMKQFLQTLPTELLDAARIDGCAELGVFFRVVVPLARPGMGVLAVLTFVSVWNDFLWPLVVTNSSSMETIQVGLSTLNYQGFTQWGLQLAGGVVAAVPVIMAFLIFQRRIVEGITVGALKG
jgi:multiple sugar transport system permease protein